MEEKVYTVVRADAYSTIVGTYRSKNRAWKCIKEIMTEYRDDEEIEIVGESWQNEEYYNLNYINEFGRLDDGEYIIQETILED